MDLVRYRDAGMHTYTYFYVNEYKILVSPYFDTEEEALEWFNKVFDGVEE